jgi:hypothetical protein
MPTARLAEPESDPVSWADNIRPAFVKAVAAKLSDPVSCAEMDADKSGCAGERLKTATWLSSMYPAPDTVELSPNPTPLIARLPVACAIILAAATPSSPSSPNGAADKGDKPNI